MASIRRKLGLLGYTVCALALVDACAQDAEEHLGHVFIDAGTRMMDGDEPSLVADAGRVLVDAGVAMTDASRTPPRPGASAQETDNRSGSRIELRETVLEGSDGFRHRQYVTYFDTELNEPCTALRMRRDDSMRCVPASRAQLADFYADNGCQEPVHVQVGACSVGYAIRSYLEEGECSVDASYRVFRVEAEHSGVVYRKTENGACASTSRVDGYSYFRVGEELVPGDFVELTSTTRTL